MTIRKMARYSEIKKVLKKHNLRITDVRVEVLKYYMNQNRTLSLRDLQLEFQDFDRVTLYRTVGSFMKNGILHKIPDDSGFATFGLCHDTCDSADHNHDHIHFKCQECGIMECLDQKIPSIKIPEYKVNEINMIMKGVCKSCVA